MKTDSTFIETPIFFVTELKGNPYNRDLGIASSTTINILSQGKNEKWYVCCNNYFNTLHTLKQKIQPEDRFILAG